MNGIRIARKLTDRLVAAGLRRRIVAKPIEQNLDEYDSSEYFNEIDNLKDVERSEEDSSEDGFYIEFEEECGNPQLKFDVSYAIDYDGDNDKLTCKVCLPTKENGGLEFDIDTISHYTDDFRFVGGGAVEKALKQMEKNNPEIYSELQSEYKKIVPEDKKNFVGKGNDYDKVVQFIKNIGQRARDFVNELMYLTESKKKFASSFKNEVANARIIRIARTIARSQGIGF